MNQHRFISKYSLLGFVWFIFLFTLQLVTFLLSRWVSPNSVIFTQGLRVLGITAIGPLVGLAYWIRRNPGWAKGPFLIAVTLLASLTFYSFLITIPTLLDRSISVFLLAELRSDPDQQMNIDDLNASFVKGYVNGDFQTQKRVVEQIGIGNFIRLESNEVKLSTRGKFVSTFNLFLARIFRVDPRYTDRGK